jgi:hypothetical protein
MKKQEGKLWDVAVIGGGPAGMMAAGRAAELGAKVVLIEKNETLGVKLLITGGGRCNVTNAETNTRALLSKFKESDKFLFSPFSQWGAKETLHFFNSRNMPTKVEAEQRVFPMSNSAQSVWDVLVAYIEEGGVTVLADSPVMSFKTQEKSITSVCLKGGQEVQAKSFILATGGTSRPETGSTGDGFKWLREIGHTVTEPSASLVPIAIKDAWVKQLAGVTLQDVKITLFQNNVRQSAKSGKILFTHFGVSGPTILNMSREIDELLKYGSVEVSLDLFPTQDHGLLSMTLVEIFKLNTNKKFKNSLSPLISSTLASLIVKLSGIDPETPCHSITREERLTLVKLLKDLRMSVKGLLGVDKAVVTSGGVKLDEVDFKTMRSRLYSNLYLVGDILDIDRPSGGYSLQLCWTTGFVAGTSAAKDLPAG